MMRVGTFDKQTCGHAESNSIEKKGMLCWAPLALLSFRTQQLESPLACIWMECLLQEGMTVEAPASI
eukprot:1154561-Pelagomonas_calceolata.AAC.4